MKKLINRPGDAVREMAEGLASVYPGLRLLPGRTVLVRDDAETSRESRVAVISGGGSGHEPAHAGYVGRGMLSAAVAGDVFTSPAPDAVLAAIRAASGGPGCLLVVKNYTGDRLNFGLAAEMARAEGIPVEMVIVADDVAMGESTDHAGRRGLAGTVLVHKVAGAAAESGASLAEVLEEARSAAKAVRTMGVALSACIVPAAGKPSFTLDEDEVELGLGIHGEPGVERVPIGSADDLVERLLGRILGDLSPAQGQRVALLVNGLGATPAMELAIVARKAIAVLEGRGLRVERAYQGTFLSALEMAGVSLSILPVDHARLARLDAPTEAPAWPNAASRPRVSGSGSPPPEVTTRAEVPAEPPRTPQGMALGEAIRRAIAAVHEAADRLTEMDRAVGDGDLGISLARGAHAMEEALPRLPLDDPGASFRAMAHVVQESVGGTSGPLWAAFLTRASRALPSTSAASPGDWARAFRDGCGAISDLGGAGPGDRTMLDALLPACDAFEAATSAGKPAHEAMAEAVTAASRGAIATADMSPRKGRSSYLGERTRGLIDPGAQAVVVLLAALAPTGPLT